MGRCFNVTTFVAPVSRIETTSILVAEIQLAIGTGWQEPNVFHCASLLLIHYNKPIELHWRRTPHPCWQKSLPVQSSG